MAGSWIGLFAIPDKPAFYKTKPISKASLETDGDFRILLRKNKYYEKDSGKPLYVLTFEDANSKYNSLAVEENLGASNAEKIAEIKSLIRKGNADCIKRRTPSESYDVACDYYTRLLNLVSDLTGEKVNFKTYMF